MDFMVTRVDIDTGIGKPPTRDRLTGLQLHSVELVFTAGKHIDEVIIERTSEDRKEKSCKTERRRFS